MIWLTYMSSMLVLLLSVFENYEFVYHMYYFYFFEGQTFIYLGVFEKILQIIYWLNTNC